MTETVRLSLGEVEDLANRALAAAGASADVAAAVARAVMAAERDGISSHGLAYVSTYCEHLVCGKVRKEAQPTASVAGSVVKVDADSGFAHPAISLGFSHLVPLARELGSAVLAVRNSYNCGVLGFHTSALAERGLLGIGFTNAPASIAPSGGLRPLLGTNPWSIAVPDGGGGTVLVIDQSASVVAKSEVMKRARAGEPMPPGWALDSAGRPTTDPAEGLKGTMAPAGGYKGVGSALLVEVLAACLTGATLGVAASPFSGPAGGPPRTGQFFIAIDPDAVSDGLFVQRIAQLVSAFSREEGGRIPGRGRAAARNQAVRDGVLVDRNLVDRIQTLGGAS